MKQLNPFDNTSGQDRFGLKLAARLSGSMDDVPHDVSERLRVARMRALELRKNIKMRTAAVVLGSGGAASLSFDNEKTGVLSKFASFLPLLALIAGLISINLIQNDDRANDLAEVDAALLTDVLPTAAFTDPGFAQFLKINKEPN
jgi:hypothetical protein